MRSERRKVLKRCQQLANSLPLPSPFDLEAFLAELAARRDRPIEFRPVATLADSPCGVLVSLTDRDVIGYVNSTRLHEEHIVLHEVGHLICGHIDTRLADSALVRMLVPDLSPDLISNVLGRSAFSDREEQEAELVASLFLYRAGRAPAPLPPRHLSADDSATLRRIASAFDGKAPENP